MALLASLAPQQPFSILGAELNPLIRIASHSWYPNPLWNLAVRRVHLVHRLRMGRDVLAELFQEKCVHHFRLFMWHLPSAKTSVELQGMTSRAILRERDWRHVALS